MKKERKRETLISEQQYKTVKDKSRRHSVQARAESLHGCHTSLNIYVLDWDGQIPIRRVVYHVNDKS